MTIKTKKSLPRQRTKEIASESSGLRLRAFRLRNGLLQSDLGKKIGLTGRVISYIEQGLRDLTEEEISRFEKQFKVKFDQISTRIDSQLPHSEQKMFYDERKFFELQQKFLLSQDEASYDLWFVNPELLPMLESNEVTATWVDNLKEGFTYHTIWLFDVTLPEDLQRFISKVTTVLKLLTIDLDASGKQNGVGEIHVYPIELGLPGSTDLAALKEYYAELSDAVTRDQLAKTTLRLHRIFNIEETGSSKELWEFLIRFYFDSASVVCYKPRSPLFKPMVAMALKDVSDFDRSDSLRVYCLLGDSTIKKFMRLLRYVENLFINS